EHEVTVVLAVDDLVRRRDDRAADLLVQQAELHVRLGRGLLDHAERRDETAREPEVADREVLDRPLRRRAPERVGRNLHLAQRVPLYPVALLRHGPPRWEKVKRS